MWKCNECSWEGNDPVIVPAMDGCNVVDIIDILCPKCAPGEPKFHGPKEDLDKWWGNYYAEQEEKSSV